MERSCQHYQNKTCPENYWEGNNLEDDKPVRIDGKIFFKGCHHRCRAYLWDNKSKTESDLINENMIWSKNIHEY
jgi:hypothetical protein